MYLHQNPFFEQLKDAKNILLAGAGGGFDIYSGIPLYFNLKQQGKNVHLANLSFVWMEDTSATPVFPHCHIVTRNDIKTVMKYYFPEKYLCEYFYTQGIDEKIFCFSKVGVQPLYEAYKFLVDKLNIDTIILVDGGTDSLMFGNEEGLGTPVEDIASMSAAFLTNVPRKFLVCLGFGVDHFHGVSHYHFLENVSRIAVEGGYLGVIQLLREMEEVQHFLNAVEHTNSKMKAYPSIVANSIASAIEGFYGNYHRTFRTQGSQLWINPLMSMYWCFNLDVLMQFNGYHHLLKDTITASDINQIIQDYRSKLLAIRTKQRIPI